MQIYGKNLNSKRIHLLSDGEVHSAPVLYLMSRDQRASDNWALLYAQSLALELKAPLYVCFYLVPNFLGAGTRHYSFMLLGLKRIASDLQEKKIPFFFIDSNRGESIKMFAESIKAAAIVTDFDPLKIKRAWISDFIKTTHLPVFEVDAHNIVPCRIASDKQEWAAYTFRPKINKLLPQFLDDFSKVIEHPFHNENQILLSKINNNQIFEKYKNILFENEYFKSGEAEAKNMLNLFISYKLNKYALTRNNVLLDGLSNLSPYLHFGQLSAQRVALEVMKEGAEEDSKNAFLEELIVRRELSDNFCFYNKNYDNFDGFPDWAKKTLNEHRSDKRDYIYSLEEFDAALTHDKVWNFAQKQMI
nr:deoxyribodipyrimidine photo-lyase [Candidatus Kapabacteria bacterium]